MAHFQREVIGRLNPTERRLRNGEAWMLCEDCGAKLYSFDGNMDSSRRCPNPQKCDDERVRR